MMKQLITALIFAASTVTAYAETLSPVQQRWLAVYNDQIQQAKFAIQVQDNSKLCQSMNIAREAAFRIGNESFYKNHIELMRNLSKRGALCGWNLL